MGEVDHANDAIDHCVADGDQAIDRPEGQAVDQLLQEDTIHNAISRGENLHTGGCAALLEEKTDLMPDTMGRATTPPEGNGPAGDNGLTTNSCVECATALAGEPAPTGDRGA
ncbi:hypothetical protein PFUM301598_24740 [Pseudomonas fluorescens]